jgi:hypothetical protein
MVTKQQVVALAEKLGVDVEDDGSTICLTTKGVRMFDGWFAHTLLTSYGFDSRVSRLSKAEVWGLVLDDLSGASVVECDVPKCDYCRELIVKWND